MGSATLDARRLFLGLAGFRISADRGGGRWGTKAGASGAFDGTLRLAYQRDYMRHDILGLSAKPYAYYQRFTSIDPIERKRIGFTKGTSFIPMQWIHR